MFENLFNVNDYISMFQTGSVIGILTGLFFLAYFFVTSKIATSWTLFKKIGEKEYKCLIPFYGMLLKFKSINFTIGFFIQTAYWIIVSVQWILVAISPNLLFNQAFFVTFNILSTISGIAFLVVAVIAGWKLVSNFCPNNRLVFLFFILPITYWIGEIYISNSRKCNYIHANNTEDYEEEIVSDKEVKSVKNIKPSVSVSTNKTSKVEIKIDNEQLNNVASIIKSNILSVAALGVSLITLFIPYYSYDAGLFTTSIKLGPILLITAPGIFILLFVIGCSVALIMKNWHFPIAISGLIMFIMFFAFNPLGVFGSQVTKIGAWFLLISSLMCLGVGGFETYKDIQSGNLPISISINNSKVSNEEKTDEVEADKEVEVEEVKPVSKKVVKKLVAEPQHTTKKKTSVSTKTASKKSAKNKKEDIEEVEINWDENEELEI